MVQHRHVWMDPGSAGVSGLIIRHFYLGDPARGNQTAICVQVAHYATCLPLNPKPTGILFSLDGLLKIFFALNCGKIPGSFK